MQRLAVSFTVHDDPKVPEFIKVQCGD